MTAEAEATSKVRVDQLPSKYNSRTGSNMPSLLVEYGLPGAEQPDQSEPRKRQTKKVRIKVNRDSNFEKEEMDTKTNTKKAHYLQVYDDIQQLNQYYYEDHIQQLQDKVIKQRQEIKRKSELSANKRRLEENTKRNEKFGGGTLSIYYLGSTAIKVSINDKSPKKLIYKAEISADDSFLANIPKSKYYKIVPLYDRLVATGTIRNTTDTDNFWKNIRDPKVFNQFFSDEDASDTLKPSSLIETLTKPKVSEIPPMSMITESQEPSSSGLVSQFAQKPSAGHKKPLDPYTIARMAAMELDQKFPQIVLPKLSCFSTDLNDKPPDPEEIMRQMDAEQREKERLLFVKRIRRMYHLSQSNVASTQRIMDKHNEVFSLGQQAPDLEHLLALQELTSAERCMEQEEAPPPDCPWMHHVRRRRRSIMTIQEEAEDTPQPRRFGPLRTVKEEIPRRKIHDALSLNAVQQRGKTVEAKCMSTNWSNYLGVGKSVFAE